MVVSTDFLDHFFDCESIKFQCRNNLTDSKQGIILNIAKRVFDIDN